jgi:hypothetical protein
MPKGLLAQIGVTGSGDPHEASSDRTADRGDAHHAPGGRERHARWAVPVRLPGSKPSLLALVGGVSVAGTLLVGQGGPAGHGHVAQEPDRTGIWAQLQQQPLLRDLALVIALAAMLGRSSTAC